MNGNGKTEANAFRFNIGDEVILPANHLYYHRGEIMIVTDRWLSMTGKAAYELKRKVPNPYYDRYMDANECNMSPAPKGDAEGEASRKDAA